MNDVLADILIVDDTVANLQILSRLLKDAGYAVRATSKSDVALNSARSHPPALMLIDVCMPDMNGFELCGLLKQDIRTRQVPVIFVSALNDIRNRVYGFKVGGVDFISKPFQREEILARVQTHITLHRMQDELEQLVKERTAELEQRLYQLRETELAMDLTGIGIHRVDEENGQFVYVNDYFCQIHGYTREELLGMTLLDINPTLPSISFREIAKPLRLKGSGRFETMHRRKDGCVFPVEITHYYRPASAERGGHFISFMSDISERKRAEEDLHIAATAFETIEGIMITDSLGSILRVNRAFLEITGYIADEVLTETATVFKPEHHDDFFYRHMWEAIEKTGAWRGEITDRRKNGQVFPSWVSISTVKNAEQAVTHYVITYIDITERKAAEQQINHLAFYDSLTDLPNRRCFLDRLQQALINKEGNNRINALLLIDLDNFKVINDTLGHDSGDMLLQLIAQRLALFVRKEDIVARLGGDEFIIMLDNLSEIPRKAIAQARNICRKMMATLTDAFQLNARTHHCTFSIGITLFGTEQNSMEELLKQADIAMYQAKRSGRNKMCFFDQDMQKAVEAYAALEKDLAEAINNQQFELYYQVQVDMQNRPLGAEALLRWVHPAKGCVSPVEFIPLAEESGMILSIGQWVIEAACKQLKLWEQDVRTRHLTLAVNVSAKQFHQENFAAQVKEIVRLYEINPKLLKLELTEGMLLESVSHVVNTMNLLKQIGIQFCMDDFGTGYSSLEYLKRLPISQLKIDQAFIKDMTIEFSSISIVKTIIAMANSLDLDVIAEGVETEEQRNLLLENGCCHYQGYLFGRPEPLEQFYALLESLLSDNDTTIG